jgi:hypothetical protein
MAWTAPRTWVTNEILSKALLDEQVRDNLDYLKLNIALEAAGELTISSGAVTKSRSHHTIDTESDAASDDLATILGGAEGEVIMIRPADGARTVVLKHNTGNIWNSSGEDISLDDADDYVLLAYSGSKWSVIGGGGIGHHAPTHKNSGDDEILLNELGEPSAAVNFNLQEAASVLVEGLASEPDLTIGRIYMNTTSHKLFYCKEDA